MARAQDTAALLKRLLVREVTDSDQNEVLDELVGLKDRVELTDQAAVDETAAFRWVLGIGALGFCELAGEQLAVISGAGWQACTGTNVDLTT